MFRKGQDLNKVLCVGHVCVFCGKVPVDIGRKLYVLNLIQAALDDIVLFKLS